MELENKLPLLYKIRDLLKEKYNSAKLKKTKQKHYKKLMDNELEILKITSPHMII